MTQSVVNEREKWSANGSPNTRRNKTPSICERVPGGVKVSRNNLLSASSSPRRAPSALCGELFVECRELRLQRADLVGELARREPPQPLDFGRQRFGHVGYSEAGGTPSTAAMRSSTADLTPCLPASMRISDGPQQPAAVARSFCLRQRAQRARRILAPSAALNAACSGVVFGFLVAIGLTIAIEP